MVQQSWKVILLSEVIPVGTLSILALIIVWVLFPLLALCNLHRSRRNGQLISYEDALCQIYTSVFLAAFPIQTVVERVDWVKARKNETVTEVLQPGDQTDRPPPAERPEPTVVLFVGRQPNHRGKGLPVRYCADCEWLKKPRFWTYFYFAVVLALAMCWGIVVFWDNFWYKKTNTCNDINPDSAYVCYEVDPPDYPVANCTQLVGKEVDVLCFQDSQSFPTALGIGFSIFQFVLLIGKIGFSVATWFGSQGDSYFWSHLFSFATIFLGILALIVLVGYPAIANTLFNADAEANLFFGHPPLRWWMYCLLLITLFCLLVLLGILAYMYHKNPTFQEMAKVIERKQRSDSIEMDKLKRPRAKTTVN